MRNENVKLWESSAVPWCGFAGDLILFKLEIYSLQKLQSFLRRCLLIMVVVSIYQKKKQ